ncbi:DUF5709 domain-containing protein [Cellulomonas sp. KRMCY2]|uniref:DUF5709 domain-containing protein n=1 Tax=Cellulomonas sp. KRMCY2 TaxID=1304865 RepID=UPI00045EADD0|nr:DUF5709 domain-containing protein [Cellulomonas sp. KRMCY2]
MTTYGDTPATSPDPEGTAEGDTDQLSQEDTLIDRSLADALDEGYVPPDYPTETRFGRTALEEARGETLAERLAREQPEVWQTADGPDAGARDPERIGRLVPGVVEPTGDSAASLMADDVGVAGGAASAEEAAVHVIEDEDLPDDDGDLREGAEHEGDEVEQEDERRS